MVQGVTYKCTKGSDALIYKLLAVEINFLKSLSCGISHFYN